MLSYANAGHPLPLVSTSEDGVVPLPGVDVPVGMFPDRRFAAETYLVPAGARILLYSDGVLGEPPQMAEFMAVFREWASATSSLLDDLIEEIPASEDDRSLVLLTFPETTAAAE